MAKKFFFIIVCTLMSLTMSAQWYGYGSRGGYGYHQRRYNPTVRNHQRMIIRQQRAIQRQQMRLAFGQRVYFSGGCYYYYNTGMRVISSVPQPRVYIYSKTQMCDAMNAIIMRTLLNGHFVFVHDPQTGELTQLTLQQQEK